MTVPTVSAYKGINVLPFRYVLTVSELTEQIRDFLEAHFSHILVDGEISNLRIPPSGHVYFSLKDELSQIRAVIFRMEARSLKFLPKDGLHVICRGRVGVYEKRGEYQLILESMEPKGIGALQLAFLQLKERLEKEGLFDVRLKKVIPMIPERIGIVTSPTGAVIRDMIQVIQRRFENVHILLYPVRVQGEGASSEIAGGIRYFNDQMNVDAIIVGRGGGSLEDLQAFNEEVVARAIYHSRIPVISAVGHETDFTIADFAADLRAPTPSAAAELAVRDKRELKSAVEYLRNNLETKMKQILQSERTDLSHLLKILVSPKKKIEDRFLRVDEFLGRLCKVAFWTCRRNRERCLHLGERVSLRNPIRKIDALRSSLSQAAKRLEQSFKYSIEIKRQKTRTVIGKLESLSPLSILGRGYSITRKIPSLEIVRDAGGVREGEMVEVTLHKGSLLCAVEKTR